MGRTEMADSEKKNGSGPETVELYRTAFARLNFQDEYLFKFSTVFLTAHGALAVLAGSEEIQNYLLLTPPNYLPLIILSSVGIVLAVIWWFWTHHNDYWHSVWTGALRDLEKNLKTKGKLFNLKHHEIAKKGGRSSCLIPRGHSIAKWIPSSIAAAWLSVFLYCLLKLLQP